MANPIIYTEARDMINGEYHIEVQPYLFGQFRIQLVKGENIVREACTYELLKCVQTVVNLRACEDPEGWMQDLATKENCKGEGGRIRLDQ